MCAWAGVRGGGRDARGNVIQFRSSRSIFFYQLMRLLEGPHNCNCVECKKKMREREKKEAILRLLSHNNFIFLRSKGFSAKGACWNELGVQACVY